MIDGSEKRKRQLVLNFRIRVFMKSAVIHIIYGTIHIISISCSILKCLYVSICLFSLRAHLIWSLALLRVPHLRLLFL